MWLIEAARRARREPGVVKFIQQRDLLSHSLFVYYYVKVYTGRAQVLCAQRKAGGRAGGWRFRRLAHGARSAAAWFLHISPVRVTDSTSVAFEQCRMCIRPAVIN